MNKPKRQICVGIDLGTSSSCCSYVDPVTKQLIVLSQGTNRSTIPSVVHFSPSNLNDVLVGEQALARGPSFPKNTIFGSKRLIGLTESGLDDNDRALADLSYGPFDLGINSTGQIGFKMVRENQNPEQQEPVVTPTMIATKILEHFKAQVETQTGNCTIGEVVLTVPAYFTPDQRSETAKAAQNAGLKVLRLIPEPTAAAFAYVQAARSTLAGQHLKDKEPDYILVYDFGGGTLDCSLVRQTYHGSTAQDKPFDPADSQLEVLATAGDPLLGGADLDNDLVKWCVKQLTTRFNCQPSVFLDNANKTRRLRQICKDAKESLSNTMTVDLDLDDLYNREQFSVKLTRPIFHNICRDTIKRAFNPIKQVLLDANVDKSLVKDVVLVGGSSRIPVIQDRLKAFFNFGDISQLARTVNPDECVAKGAALFAATLTSFDWQRNNHMLASCVNSFPLTLCYRYGSQRQFVPLIKLNQPLPAKGVVDIELDRATLAKIDPPLLRTSVFQVPLPTPPSSPAPKEWVEEQFKSMKDRLFKRWAIPVEGVSNFGDLSPYVVSVHYQIDENGIMDIFFEDKELNLIIDVSLNKNTTETVVKEQLSTQAKVDVLHRYQAAVAQQQLPIPPPPTTALRSTPTMPPEQVPHHKPRVPAELEQKTPAPQIPVKLPPTKVEPKAEPKPSLPTTPVVEPAPAPVPVPTTAQPPQFVPPQPTQAQPPPFVAPTQTVPQQQQQTEKSHLPPPIPAHINQKLIEQLRDIVQVRDDMIIQLQSEIISLKNQYEQRNTLLNSLNQDFESFKYDQEQYIYQLKMSIYEKDLLLAQSKEGQEEKPVGDDKLFTQRELDNKVALVTGPLNERLETVEAQYVQLYDHYDALAAENQQTAMQLEQKGLELSDVSAKLQHAQTRVEHSEAIQSRFESQIEKLESDLQAANDGYAQLQHDYEQLKQQQVEKAKPETETAESTAETGTESDQTPKLPPPFIPPPFTRQASAAVFTSEEQSDLVLASMPPLPPIAPTIFTPSIPKHLPPPLPSMRVRAVAAPAPIAVSAQPISIVPHVQTESSNAAMSTTQSQLPTSQLFVPPSLHPPQPPPPPPMAPKAPHIPDDYQSHGPDPVSLTITPQQNAGGSGKAFLADIMSRPPLKKVKVEEGSSQSGPDAAKPDPKDGSETEVKEQTEPKAPPRITLLSQIQSGAKNLKSVKAEKEAETEDGEQPAGLHLGNDLMSRITKLRSQVADDEAEEEGDEDEW